MLPSWPGWSLSASTRRGIAAVQAQNVSPESLRQLTRPCTPGVGTPEVRTRAGRSPPLKRPVFFEATWELRFGPGDRFRVFYDLDHQQHVVAILAIGIKRGNRLLIGGEEIRL
jgi:hypothetical protein